MDVGIQHHRCAAFGKSGGAVQGVGFAGVKGGIEAAVGVVAGEGEVDSVTPGDENPAVGLDGDAVAKIRAAEIGRELAASTERGIGTAEGVVAGEREVVAVSSGNEDPAVGLDGDAAAGIRATAEVGRERPASTEQCIETAVAVVADEGEVAFAGKDSNARSGNENLSVGLYGDAVAFVGVVNTEVS